MFRGEDLGTKLILLQTLGVL